MILTVLLTSKQLYLLLIIGIVQFHSILYNTKMPSVNRTNSEAG